MKNIHSPTEEEFILTHKKKRIIKSVLKEFLRSIQYFTTQNKFHTPELDEVAKFLIKRAIFLKYITMELNIELINGEFTAVHFRYKKEWMIVENQIAANTRHKIFIQNTIKFKPLEKIDQYETLKINCLEITNKN